MNLFIWKPSILKWHIDVWIIEVVLYIAIYIATFVVYAICDPPWENRAYVHINFDQIFGIWNFITLCLNLVHQWNIGNYVVRHTMGNVMQFTELYNLHRRLVKWNNMKRHILCTYALLSHTWSHIIVHIYIFMYLHAHVT